jgi:hypothetical protein
MNLLPEHLDYNFTQILFIGEKASITGDIDELEQLEEEDEARVNHLKGINHLFCVSCAEEQVRMRCLKI